MRLPDTAHTSRPWRIHELTPEFRLEDVWVLPTPGGPDDFPSLVRLIASGNASRDWPGVRNPLTVARPAARRASLPSPFVGAGAQLALSSRAARSSTSARLRPSWSAARKPSLPPGPKSPC